MGSRGLTASGRYAVACSGTTLASRIGGESAQDTQAGIDYRNDFDDLRADGINNERRTLGDFVLDDQTRQGDTVRNVDASSLVESYYLMGLLKWEKLEFTGGARHEQEERSFFIYPDLNPNDVAENKNPDETDRERILAARCQPDLLFRRARRFRQRQTLGSDLPTARRSRDRPFTSSRRS